jgi:hypothetical protein
MAVEVSIAAEPRNVIRLNSQRADAALAIDFRRLARRKTRLCDVPHALTVEFDHILILQLRKPRPRCGLGAVDVTAARLLGHLGNSHGEKATAD